MAPNNERVSQLKGAKRPLKSNKPMVGKTVEGRNVLAIDHERAQAATTGEGSNGNQGRFVYFPKLPFELRTKIWKFAMSESRLVELHSRGSARRYEFYLRSSDIRFRFTIPVILEVCHEAREIGKKVYTVVIPGVTMAPIYFNLGADVLFVRLSGNREPRDLSRHLVTPAQQAEYESFLSQVRFLYRAAGPIKTTSDLEALQDAWPGVEKIVMVNQRHKNYFGGISMTLYRLMKNEWRAAMQRKVSGESGNGYLSEAFLKRIKLVTADVMKRDLKQLKCAK